ncbi:MAG: head decoration protein, partial [Variibacter sp.]|nr:head decoration protein [Variibacter sp.]
AGSGKIVAFDADATDGSEEPYGIAIAPAAAQDGVDGAVLMLVRGPAIVYGPELVWPAGISDAGKATAIAQLAAKGIVVRNA